MTSKLQFILIRTKLQCIKALTSDKKKISMEKMAINL